MVTGLANIVGGYDAIVVASLSMIRLTNSRWMEIQMCLGGSELRPGNRRKENGHRLQRGAGVGPGTGGQSLGQKPPPPPRQQNQRPQNQRQKAQAQSRAPSPVQEENRMKFYWQL